MLSTLHHASETYCAIWTKVDNSDLNICISSCNMFRCVSSGSVYVYITQSIYLNKDKGRRQSSREVRRALGFGHSALNPLGASVNSLNNDSVLFWEISPQWANTLRLQQNILYGKEKHFIYALIFTPSTATWLEELAYHYTPYCEEKITSWGVGIASRLKKPKSILYCSNMWIYP